MTLAIHTATATKQAANLKVRTAGGLKGAEHAYIRTATGLVRFFSKFAVSVNGTGTSAGFNSGSTALLTTRTLTASVTGAVGAVTYLWTQTGGDTMTITQPNSAATAFSASVAPGESLVGTFKCTISDASGHSADTDEITATISNHYGGTL